MKYQELSLIIYIHNLLILSDILILSVVYSIQVFFCNSKKKYMQLIYLVKFPKQLLHISPDQRINLNAGMLCFVFPLL